jgi:signal peptidase I
MRRSLLALAVGALLTGVVLRSRLTLVTVTGDSMWPALVPGDQVLVRRVRLGRIRPGQVVVVEAPAPAGHCAGPLPGRLQADRQWIIKRVAAVPGDPRPHDIPPDKADPQVPPGRFALLGDNAAWSHDSRQLGYVPGDRLLGVVVRRIARTGRGGMRPGGPGVEVSSHRVTVGAWTPGRRAG